MSALDGARAIVNLAGRTLDCRHTPENKREIRASRRESVAALGDAASTVSRPPEVWVQMSAVGYYGDSGDEVCTEDAPPGDDFVARIAQEWEKAFAQSCPDSVRPTVMRTGFVLGPDGGALPVLTRLTRLGLGGATGNGRQFISWIHVDDVAGAMLFAIRDSTARGTYNLCAPAPKRNAEFMRAMRSALNRPWCPPAPGFLVEIGAAIMGTEADLSLKGQRCSSERLLQDGYRFRHPDFEAALADAIPRDKAGNN